MSKQTFRWDTQGIEIADREMQSARGFYYRHLRRWTLCFPKSERPEEHLQASFKGKTHVYPYPPSDTNTKKVTNPSQQDPPDSSYPMETFNVNSTQPHRHIAYKGIGKM
ncbi:hypothetical protein STEG23_025384 [Scotinomys teguina]